MKQRFDETKIRGNKDLMKQDLMKQTFYETEFDELNCRAFFHLLMILLRFIIAVDTFKGAFIAFAPIIMFRPLIAFCPTVDLRPLIYGHRLLHLDLCFSLFVISVAP